MDRFTAYLRIPAQYAAGLKDLHWSAAGDAIEFGQGGTFAFPAEVFQFLEGFVSQRPLIHFGHIIHLLYLLKRSTTPFLGNREGLLVSAFTAAQHPYRNAGVFCALLCKDIPAVPDEPLLTFRTGTFELEVGASEPPFTEQNGEMPALPGEVFEARVLFELSCHNVENILHWFRHGRGPVREAGEEIAHSVLLDKPRSLQGALADLAQRQRLSGAVPFVEQLVSALTLPPRRLERPELPLGGYSDVATRGQVEQLLPSQFAFDDLEFVRRHAERELLYFRREDPHVHTQEDLVVLLDQGVRTWGPVRLVLTAALFALGRLAERRRLPFLVAATSDGGLLDPLQAAAAELQELIEASDLSAHPGAALERVLSEETETARDIVLLTHPRNLAEPKVIAAARQLRPGARLFAVAVDEHGDVQFSAVRGGVPVILSRFHVDLERTAPPPVRSIADPLTAWRGDVEPVPFPFRFGAADGHKPMQFAFDATGDWLLVATHDGMLYATRTDGSRSEILPRGLVRSTIVTIVTNVTQVIGVAGGFVVVTVRPEQVLALHYNFSTRTCVAYPFASPRPDPVRCFYLRALHTLVVEGRKTECIHLSTGSRGRPPAAFETLDDRLGAYPLPIQGAGEPSAADTHWEWPQMHFDRESGAIRLKNVRPTWEQFTPLSDNEPILKDCKLEGADCQGHTLAALFSNPLKPAVSAMLRLFQGPHGVPLAAFPQSRNARRFTLSSDGRLLARETGRGRVEIRDVRRSNVPQHVTAVGRFHPQVQVELGDCWLSLRIDRTVHLAHWQRGVLVLKSGRWDEERVKTVLKEAGLSTNGVRATLGGRPPGFLPLDPGRRFGPTAHHHLFALVDRFGEVALFEPTGELVCVFFAFRQLAVWMPEGTCYGPTSLLGRPATPGALEKIGAALRAASARGERTVI
jgi:hypothetical protein